MTRGALLVAWLVLWLVVSASLAQDAGPATLPASAPAERKAVVIEVSGEITDVTTSYLRRRYERAEALGATVVILRLDTWGGGVGAALDISQFIKSQAPRMTTIAFVHRKAVSAGVLIAIACDKITTESSALLGDCAPISPGQQLQPTERAKAEGPILAEFYDSAVRNHHDPLLVQSMVSLGRAVYYVQGPAGEKRFVDQTTYDKLSVDQWKPVEGVPNPVNADTSLLTVSGTLAARLGLAAYVAADVDAVARAEGLSVIARYEPGAGQWLIDLLNNDVVRGLLIVVLLASGFIALSHPGTGAPEVVCMIALATLLGVPLLTGWASWLEVTLILVGVALLALEVFVIPGFGVTGIAGLVLVGVGLILTFAPGEPAGTGGILPALPATRLALQQGTIATLLGTVVSLALWFWFSRYLPKLPYFNRLVLQTSVGETLDPARDALRDQLDAAWPGVGATGVAYTDLRPGGVGAFRDDLINDFRNVDVVCDLGFVTAGSAVVVREKEGNRVVVRPAGSA